VKYQGKTPFNTQYTLKNEGQEGKIGPVQSGYQWEGGGQTERGVYLVYLYENRMMKPVGIVLRRGEKRELEERWRGESKIHCKHIV
jgi:hypothetical protein